MSNCGHREDCAYCRHPHFNACQGVFLPCSECDCGLRDVACEHDVYLDIDGPIPTGTPALWRCYNCSDVWVATDRDETEHPQPLRKHLKRR